MQKLSLMILNPDHHVAKLVTACEAQYALTKRYSLNRNPDPKIMYGIFLIKRCVGHSGNG